MKDKHRKLSLDRPAVYQIKIPGVIGDMRHDWVESMIVEVESEDTDTPLSTLTVTVDQAGLLGLLRRLYSMGLPLISVVCIDFEQPEPAD